MKWLLGGRDKLPPLYHIEHGCTAATKITLILTIDDGTKTNIQGIKS